MTTAGHSSSGGIDDSLVDSQLVGMLVAMGFPWHKAAKAALETGNTGEFPLLVSHLLAVTKANLAHCWYAAGKVMRCIHTVSRMSLCACHIWKLCLVHAQNKPSGEARWPSRYLAHPVTSYF